MTLDRAKGLGKRHTAEYDRARRDPGRAKAFDWRASRAV